MQIQSKRARSSVRNTTSKFQIVFGPDFIYLFIFLDRICRKHFDVAGAVAVLSEGQNTVIHVGIEKDKNVALKMTQ